VALDKAKFFDTVRKSLFGSVLTQNQVTVMESIVDRFDGSAAQLAYVLATPYHEVGRDLVPVVENLNYTAARLMKVWPGRFKTLAAAKPFAHSPEALGNKVYGGRLGSGPNEGFRYRGRGLAQITGRDLYARLSELIGVDLVGNPDRALDPDIAAHVLVVGMRDGLFTGKRLSDYINASKTDYVNARRIINADVAANGKKIAGYAEKFRAALR
jgi:putative chitinase